MTANPFRVACASLLIVTACGGAAETPRTTAAATTPTVPALPTPTTVDLEEVGDHVGDRVVVEGILDGPVIMSCFGQSCWLEITSGDDSQDVLLELRVSEAPSPNAMQPVSGQYDPSEIVVWGADEGIIRPGDRIRVTGWVWTLDTWVDWIAGFEGDTPVISRFPPEPWRSSATSWGLGFAIEPAP